MSSVGFYLPGVLVLATSVIAIAAKQSRYAIAGLLASWLATGILFCATGAYLLGCLEIILPFATLGLLLWQGRRSHYDELVGDELEHLGAWLGYGAAAIGVGTLIAVAALLDNSLNRATGGFSAHLLTVLHYRYLPSLVLVIIVLATALYLLAIIGRHTDDEREYDSVAEQRREREEKLRQRQRDREAARGQRRGTA